MLEEEEESESHYGFRRGHVGQGSDETLFAYGSLTFRLRWAYGNVSNQLWKLGIQKLFWYNRRLHELTLSGKTAGLLFVHEALLNLNIYIYMCVCVYLCAKEIPSKSH